MIRTFKCKETEKVFKRRRSPKLPTDIQRVAMRKLVALNAALTLTALRTPPANRLEAPGGDREGQYGIRINDQWRICFEWSEGNAYDVEIVDYH
jgi:proteic killer suppression protein